MLDFDKVIQLNKREFWKNWKISLGVWSSGKQRGNQACINVETRVQNPSSGCAWCQVQVLSNFDNIDMPLIAQQLSQRYSIKSIYDLKIKIKIEGLWRPKVGWEI